MNEVFNTGKIIIHDDREFIQPHKAYELLQAGKSIQLCDPPDYSAENDYDVHKMPFTVTMNDIPKEYQTWPEIQACLCGYEISK